MKNRGGSRYGKITALYEKVIDDFTRVMAVVTMDGKRTDNVQLVAPLGIQWRPTIGDLIVVSYDEKGNGVLGMQYVDKLIGEDYNLGFKHYRGDNILNFFDNDDVELDFKVDKLGKIGNKATLESPAHFTEVRCDELRLDKSLVGGGATTAGLQINVNGTTRTIAVIS